MKKLAELFTNNDGRLSTTAFIQFFGALLMSGILLFCVWLDRASSIEMFITFAAFCGGQTVSKGIVNAMSQRNRQEDE